MRNFLVPLTGADVAWVNGRLHSRSFDDIYFAPDGPKETLRAFIEPAHVFERIKSSKTFSIFEFGFGTGLNFLTLARGLIDRRINTRVRYVSVDRFPLERTDMKRALSSYRADVAMIDELLSQLPPRVRGWHRRYFNAGRLELTLCYADINEALHEFAVADRQGIDAWFLDGFAPDRNPQMWSPGLFMSMRALTNPHGTVTTYSAAGRVRKALHNAGFKVTRIENQPPQKRHTTLAEIDKKGLTSTFVPRQVVVIGGGFAGTIVARTLAYKGVPVRLYERETQVGAATSAIPAAIQHPRLSSADTPVAAFRLHAYAHAQALLQRFDPVTCVGGLHLADSGMSIERLTEVATLVENDWVTMLNAMEIRQRSHGYIVESGAWFPKSAIVNGPDLCRTLTHHDLIHLALDEHRNHAHAMDAPQIYATGAKLLNPINSLPIEAIAIPGQVDAFSADEATQLISPLVARDGYVASRDSILFAGSTYEYKPWAAGSAAHTNRQRITRLLPDTNIRHMFSFRADRVVTSDRLPVVGSVGRNQWVSWGHGSSGTITTAFAAELLASTLLNEIPIGIPAISPLLAPNRFLLRQQRRPDPLRR